MFSLRPFNVFHHFVPTHCLGFLCYTQPLHPPATPHAPTISHLWCFSPGTVMQVSGWENPPNGVWGGEARRASDRGRQQRWRQGPQKPLWDLPLHPAARQTKSPASACSCTLDAIFLAALAEAAPRVVWLLFGGGGEGVSFWIPTPFLLCCSLLFPHHPFFLCFCFFFYSHAGRLFP